MGAPDTELEHPPAPHGRAERQSYVVRPPRQFKCPRTRPTLMLITRPEPSCSPLRASSGEWMDSSRADGRRQQALKLRVVN